MVINDRMFKKQSRKQEKRRFHETGKDKKKKNTKNATIEIPFRADQRKRSHAIL